MCFKRVLMLTSPVISTESPPCLPVSGTTHRIKYGCVRLDFLPSHLPVFDFGRLLYRLTFGFPPKHSQNDVDPHGAQSRGDLISNVLILTVPRHFH